MADEEPPAEQVVSAEPEHRVSLQAIPEFDKRTPYDELQVTAARNLAQAVTDHLEAGIQFIPDPPQTSLTDAINVRHPLISGLPQIGPGNANFQPINELITTESLLRVASPTWATDSTEVVDNGQPKKIAPNESLSVSASRLERGQLLKIKLQTSGTSGTQPFFLVIGSQ